MGTEKLKFEENMATAKQTMRKQNLLPSKYFFCFQIFRADNGNNDNSSSPADFAEDIVHHRCRHTTM